MPANAIRITTHELYPFCSDLFSGFHGYIKGTYNVPKTKFYTRYLDNKYFKSVGGYMFAVIYRFKLKPDQETKYIQNWNKIASYFVEKRGATGSCLHKGDDNLWVAYSRWPSKAARDASWPGDDAPNEELPSDVIEAIQQMQLIKEENSDLEQFDEICMNVIEDKLLISKI